MKCGIDKGYRRVAIGGFGAEDTSRPIPSVTGFFGLGGSVGLVELIGMEIYSEMHVLVKPSDRKMPSTPTCNVKKFPVKLLRVGSLGSFTVPFEEWCLDQGMLLCRGSSRKAESMEQANSAQQL